MVRAADKRATLADLQADLDRATWAIGGSAVGGRIVALGAALADLAADKRRRVEALRAAGHIVIEYRGR
jgi:hypothetical protein